MFGAFCFAHLVLNGLKKLQANMWTLNYAPLLLTSPHQTVLIFLPVAFKVTTSGNIIITVKGLCGNHISSHY